MKNEKKENYTDKLKSQFELWERINEFGSSDPFYSDGVNLNLVRNHIIYYKKLIEETETPPYPEIYYRETPLKVDSNYIVGKDKILSDAKKAYLSDAKKAYNLLVSDPNYLYLLQKIPLLSEKQKADSAILAVIGYVNNLNAAIENEDYICMRRYRNPGTYVQSLADCADRIRKLPQEEVQLSLWTI